MDDLMAICCDIDDVCTAFRRSMPAVCCAPASAAGGAKRPWPSARD